MVLAEAEPAAWVHHERTRRGKRRPEHAAAAGRQVWRLAWAVGLGCHAPLRLKAERASCQPPRFSSSGFHCSPKPA
uniref:Uncharacterized protein n=1 Tax=Zea mays TaxID=4577 RepID=A0A804RHZ1_MAIZE